MASRRLHPVAPMSSRTVLLTRYQRHPGTDGCMRLTRPSGAPPGTLRRSGRQVLHDVDDHTVDYRLRNRGPGGREMTPHVLVRFDELDGARARVTLDFHAAAPLPPGLRHLVEAAMGRRVRRLHVKDPERLKQHVENRATR